MDVLNSGNTNKHTAVLSPLKRRVQRPFASSSPPQKFQSLRQNCVDNEELFEDETFDATESILYYTCYPPYPCKWLRPHVSTTTVFCIAVRTVYPVLSVWSLKAGSGRITSDYQGSTWVKKRSATLAF